MISKRYKTILFWIFLIGLALVFIGCGGGGGGSDVPPPPPPHPSPPPPPPLIQATETWIWRNPLPQGNLLYGSAYGNGIYVSVGECGEIFARPGGSDADSGTLKDLYDITFYNDTFIAVGSNDTILTSQDGLTWVSQNPDNYLVHGYHSVTCGNNACVAVGSHIASVSLNDGVTWSEITFDVPVNYGFRNVEFMNNQFVLVGDGGQVLASTDGLAWTDRSIPASLSSTDLEAVGFGNGTYVAISVSGGEVFTSPDLITWTLEPDTGIGGENISSVAFGNETFVALGEKSYEPEYFSVFTSSDAKTWTRWENTLALNLTNVAFVNGRFRAVGASGQVLESPDGVTWTDNTSRITTNSIKSIAYGNDIFIAAESATPSDALLTSADGITWTNLPTLPSDKQINRVKFVNGMFYLLCEDSVLSSADGTNWTTILQESDISKARFRDLIYANSRYVLVDYKTIRTSWDTITWSKRWEEPPLSYRSLYAIAYGNGTFAVAASDSRLLISPGGTNWTEKYILHHLGDFIDITFGNDRFVVVGNRDDIYGSTDGYEWKRVTYHLSHTQNHLNVISTNDGFIAVGYLDGYAHFCLSPDGMNWSSWILPISSRILGIAYGQDRYVVVGDAGIIIQSVPVEDTTLQSNAMTTPSLRAVRLTQ